MNNKERSLAQSSVIICVHLLYSFSCFGSDFTIHPDKPIAPPLVGIGAEMNPYLYCQPNNLDEQSAAKLEAKVLALRPQHVRIFVLPQWFHGKTDRVAKGDPHLVDSFIRVCELAQRAGATINLTNWYGPWPDPDAGMSDFAQLVEQLISKHRLSSVRYLTIQNEVNGGERMSSAQYIALYRALDSHLRRLHVRDRIQIVGGDLVYNNQEQWFDTLAKMADVCDGYSIHAYWNFWDNERSLWRLAKPRELVDAMPTQNQRPLYITEFGVRGQKWNEQKNDPGDFEDGRPIMTTPLAAVQLGKFIVDSLNYRYVATVVWNMEDSLYDHPMFYGLMGTAKEHWPLKPPYHVVRLMTHTCKPGWRAVRVDGSDKNLSLAALKGDNDLAIYIANLAEQPAAVKIDGVPIGVACHRITWASADPSQLRTLADFRGGDLHVPAMSLTALTTLEANLR